LVEGDDILGDGVNIAARLEGIAEPGGICISEDAFRAVRGKIAAEFADIGEQNLKNIARPLRVYCAGPKATFYPVTKDRVYLALGLLEQAIAIDRHYGPALVWAASCHMTLVRDNWAEDLERSRRKACDLARQALEAGENDPRILVNAANVLVLFGEEIGAMIGLVDRALALNPSYARGWFVSGLLRIFDGQHDLAIEHVETSLRLSPRERLGTPLSAAGLAYLFKRRFGEAAAKLLLSIQDHPGFPVTYRHLAACYAHMGRLDEARATVAKLRAITPVVVPSNVPFRKPEDRELYLSGLRLAAGEE
jgi:tetratricopeptide (TPR) repeat protein